MQLFRAFLRLYFDRIAEELIGEGGMTRSKELQLELERL